MELLKILKQARKFSRHPDDRNAQFNTSQSFYHTDGYTLAIPYTTVKQLEGQIAGLKSRIETLKEYEEYMKLLETTISQLEDGTFNEQGFPINNC